MTTGHPRRVVVAVDFGDASAAAVAIAGLLAETWGAQLLALHAETFDAPPYFTGAQVAAIEAEHRQARDAARAYLRAFVARYTAVAAVCEIGDGPPAAAILAAAAAADVVVMGTHGRRGARRWWLGSVAEDVVRGTRVPVIVTCALTPQRLEEARVRLRTPEPAGPDGWPEAVAGAFSADLVRGAADEALTHLRACTFPTVFVPVPADGERTS